MAKKVTAAQLARFDQATAAIDASLDLLVDRYRASIAAGHPRELTVVGLDQWLTAHFEQDAIAEHLVVAIDRMARPTPTTPEENPE